MLMIDFNQGDRNAAETREKEALSEPLNLPRRQISKLIAVADDTLPFQ